MEPMKPSFFPSSSINSACWDTAGSFDPQMPMGVSVGTRLGAEDAKIVPPGIVYAPDGSLHLSFDAPNAKSVSCEIHQKEYPMERDANGIWHAHVSCEQAGFCPLVFRIDGAEVLNPLAPIGFGGSHPINYADIPNSEGAFYALGNVPHGTVAQNYYYSESTGTWKSCLVYLPPQYWCEPERRFPVLYLQHGHGENEQCWIHQGRANFILDNLIAEGKAQPMIVVMNNGMVQRDQDGCRILDFLAIEQLLLEDCIPYIDRTYRTLADRAHRAMAGLSMGSMQTSYVTLRHPETFSYAGVFSGFVSPLGDLWRNAPDHMALLDQHDAFCEAYKVFFRACGDQDQLVIQRFEEDSRLFASKGLAPEVCPNHVIRMYRGNHEWNVWRECLRDYAQLIFQETSVRGAKE